MSDGYHKFGLVWEDHSIAVSYKANWLNSGHWHIELRCAERLPVTETGFRSHFISTANFADEADVAAFVMEWLDDAAKDSTWQCHLEDSRQLKLL